MEKKQGNYSSGVFHTIYTFAITFYNHTISKKSSNPLPLPPMYTRVQPRVGLLRLSVCGRRLRLIRPPLYAVFLQMAQSGGRACKQRPGGKESTDHGGTNRYFQPTRQSSEETKMYLSFHFGFQLFFSLMQLVHFSVSDQKDYRHPLEGLVQITVELVYSCPRVGMDCDTYIIRYIILLFCTNHFRSCAPQNKKPGEYKDSARHSYTCIWSTHASSRITRISRSFCDVCQVALRHV